MVLAAYVELAAELLCPRLYVRDQSALEQFCFLTAPRISCRYLRADFIQLCFQMLVGKDERFQRLSNVAIACLNDSCDSIFQRSVLACKLGIGI